MCNTLDNKVKIGNIIRSLQSDLLFGCMNNSNSNKIAKMTKILLNMGDNESQQEKEHK